MAITVNSGGMSGRRRFHGTSALSEINVTPFVDVVLVLLIIFMMTAHVMDSGIEVDVPKTKSVKESVKDLPIGSHRRWRDLPQ
jgi:biopolymer transport protein ExbD